MLALMCLFNAFTSLRMYPNGSNISYLILFSHKENSFYFEGSHDSMSSNYYRKSSGFKSLSVYSVMEFLVYIFSGSYL